MNLEKLPQLGDPSLGDAVATASGAFPIVLGYCLAAGWE